MIKKTAVALRDGQKQKSFWAGDSKKKPKGMVSHVLEKFGVIFLSDEKLEAATGTYIKTIVVDTRDTSGRKMVQKS